MGWGPLLWWLHVHLGAQIPFAQIVLRSLRKLRKGDGLEVAVRRLLEEQTVVAAGDRARFREVVRAAYDDLYKPAWRARRGSG